MQMINGYYAQFNYYTDWAIQIGDQTEFDGMRLDMKVIMDLEIYIYIYF